jgi:hypothetical protein
MPHHRARLTPRGREMVVRRVVDDGMSFAQAAAWGNVSKSTVWEWVCRWRVATPDERESLACLAERSSRPRHSPARVPGEEEQRICAGEVFLPGVDIEVRPRAALAVCHWATTRRQAGACVARARARTPRIARAWGRAAPRALEPNLNRLARGNNRGSDPRRSRTERGILNFAPKRTPRRSPCPRRRARTRCAATAPPAPRDRGRSHTRS